MKKGLNRPTPWPREQPPRKPDGYDQMPESIHYGESEHPGVSLLRIDRPGKMNAIGAAEARGLSEAISAFREDETARVLVITGSGPEAFCAGADLAAVAAMAPGENDGGSVEPLFETDADGPPRSPVTGAIGPTRIHDLYKPVIAAVNGVAYAGGLEWACFAHLRIADRHASFGVTNRRWDIGLGDGGTQRLARIVGLGRALDLIITGRVIGTDEALDLGLVNEVVPSGTCVERSLELAAQIAALPLESLTSDIEATVRGSGQSLEEGLEIERECFDRSLERAAHREGVRRFLSREHPDLDSDRPILDPRRRAYALAVAAHRGQEDRYGRGDFIRHPVGVAELCRPLEDPVLEVAAYLHDILEKSDFDRDLLVREFGPEMVEIVDALGQDRAITDATERRREHRTRVADADGRVQIVYLNDRRDGIVALTDRIEAGDGDARDVARSKLDAWRGDIEAMRQMESLPSDLVGQLERELERLAELTGPDPTPGKTVPDGSAAG